MEEIAFLFPHLHYLAFEIMWWGLLSEASLKKIPRSLSYSLGKECVGECEGIANGERSDGKERLMK